MKAVRLAITLGDPAGIGPEIVPAALRALPEEFRAVVVGASRPFPPDLRDRVDFRPVACPAVIPGRPSPLSARAALDALDAALDLATKGEVDALVTAPVSKAAISALGIPFAGHTEYLGARAGVRRPVMMFAGDRFRVALATTHLPLRKVPALLTSEVILHTLVEFEAGLRSLFGVPEPRIAVAGLNPHAGEEGTLGTEEAERVAPAIASARERGIRCEGPFPADTLFRRERFDGLVALYHDQALPAVKTLDPLSVNVTLGLPFVRTSPDHGTAFDIAGRGIADPAPMRQAILLATRLARAKQPLI